ncbi:MAG: SIMPL domain-containing protein [Candidatus Omnitrophota bacterium]
MEGTRILRNSQIIILGICIAMATILSSIILSKSFLKMMKVRNEIITVTGSDWEEIKSDYVVWNAKFSRRESSLPAAYNKLKEDLDKVKAYLFSKGVDEKEIIVSQISTNKFYKRNKKGNNTNDIEGYRLIQNIGIRSKDVDKITRISRESTELINKGIEVESYSPEYFYTKLDELKIKMLARAAQNAKERAKNMIEATGNKIGVMRSARMGVFQITPLNSTEVSDWGVNDTTSLEKKVTAVVSVSFAIE